MTYWIGEHADLITLSGEGQPSFAPEPEPLTPRQKTQVTIAALAKIGAFICGLFTVALLLLNAYITYGIYDILSSWPHTQAEVQSTEIYATQANMLAPDAGVSTSTTVYGFRCTVDYYAASRGYESQVDMGYQNGDRADMVPWSNRIQPGSHIEIAYNPANPAKARFAGHFTTAYAAPLSMLRYVAWLAAVGSLLILLAHRLRLPPPDTTTQPAPGPITAPLFR